MCELLAMSCALPTQLNFSLHALASHSGPASGTRDGWGVAFYQGRDVAHFREPVAASDSALVPLLESKGPATTLAISHIRRATLGAISLANTQPFARELGGCMHVFAHNGHLPGIEHAPGMHSEHHRPVGDTDSEWAFCALLERMQGLWSHANTRPSLDERLRVVQAFAAELRLLGPANFLYADAEVLFAHGHRRIQGASGRIEPPGLFYLTQHCHSPDQCLHGEGVSVAPGFQTLTVVASVPLSDAHWTPLAEGEVIAITGGEVLAWSR